MHWPRNVLVVCHVGDGAGLGHLSRSLVAAEALRSHFDAGVQLLVQGKQIRRHDLNCFPHLFIDKDQNLATAVVDEFTKQAADAVLLDLHSNSLPTPASMQAMLATLKTYGSSIIAIDGLIGYRQMLDLIFMPSFQCTAPANTRNGAPLIFGWDCFLLNLRQTPREWKPGQSVLCLTGGSDVTGLGRTWPAALDRILPADTELHWVTGPFAQSPSFPQAPRIHFHNHVAPSCLGPLMQAANYAVTVFGVSFFELLYLGIPTVVFSPYGGKDDRELDAIAQAGLAIVARDECEATDHLCALMRDDRLATQLSLRAREHINTPGGRRLCAEIAKLIHPAP